MGGGQEGVSRSKDRFLSLLKFSPYPFPKFSSSSSSSSSFSFDDEMEEMRGGERGRRGDFDELGRDERRGGIERMSPLEIRN